MTSRADLVRMRNEIDKEIRTLDSLPDDTWSVDNTILAEIGEEILVLRKGTQNDWLILDVRGMMTWEDIFTALPKSIPFGTARPMKLYQLSKAEVPFYDSETP